MIGEKTTVTICLQALFEKLTHDKEEEYVSLQYDGMIEKVVEDDREYYDLKTNSGTPCMDGETCQILEETEDYILLQEIDEFIPFKLSVEEFKKATNSTLKYKVICYNKSGDRDHIEYSENLEDAKNIRTTWGKKIGLKPEPSSDFSKYPTVWELSIDNEYYRVAGL